MAEKSESQECSSNEDDRVIALSNLYGCTPSRIPTRVVQPGNVS